MVLVLGYSELFLIQMVWFVSSFVNQSTSMLTFLPEIKNRFQIWNLYAERKEYFPLISVKVALRYVSVLL